MENSTPTRIRRSLGAAIYSFLEAFGMMLVKFEAREFQLKQTIRDLETAKAKIENQFQQLENIVK